MDWIYRLLYLYRYFALHMYMRINATKKRCVTLLTEIVVLLPQK